MTDGLSSDVLESQFGPTEIKVLHHDDEIRIIKTQVIATGQILEISFVAFRAPQNEEFEPIRQEIMAGKSLGKAFRDHGVTFTREQQVAQHRELSDYFNKQFASSGQATVVAATLVVGDDSTPYADVLETYSPDVSWPQIGGELNSQQVNQLELLSKFVESI